MFPFDASHLFTSITYYKHPHLIIFFDEQCFFDTPGLIMRTNGLPKSDIRVRVESALSSVDLYDTLLVIFDVHRHLIRFIFY